MMIIAVENKLNQYATDLNKSIQDLSIIVSFSSGIDSTVLSYLMIELREKYGFNLYLIHFNHNIHKKAKHMEHFCKSFALANDVEYYCRKLSFRNLSNFEASARDKRYIELNNMANWLKCDIIFTAHHNDDQVETLYMKKLDGADWISKIGIRESMGKIKRPCIEIKKELIKQIANNKALSWIEDPTNNDLSIRRNYIRTVLLPETVKQFPGLVSELLEDVEKYKSRLVSVISNFNNKKQLFIRYESKLFLSINLAEIINLEIEELKIFLYWSLKNNIRKKVPKQSRNFWNEFSKYLKKSRSGAKFLIGDYTCFIYRTKMILIITSSYVINRPKMIKLTTNQKWYDSFFSIKNTSNYSESINKTHFIVTDNILQHGLYLRRWNRGDKIFSSTSKKHTLVSDLFINNKLSEYDKLVQPIVVDKREIIVWIPGIAHAKIEDNYDINNMKVLEWEQL